MPGLKLERVLTASHHGNDKIFVYKETFLHALELYLDTNFTIVIRIRLLRGQLIQLNKAKLIHISPLEESGQSTAGHNEAMKIVPDVRLAVEGRRRHRDPDRKQDKSLSREYAINVLWTNW